MDTHQPQHDTDYPKTDPAFDALLDEAVSAGTPPVDPDLAKRIYDQTTPMLNQRPVLARIGPNLLRIAAAAAIVVAAGLFTMVQINQPQDNEQIASGGTDTEEKETINLVETDPIEIESIAPSLAEINKAYEPGNTVIDQQMDVLALRVELASNENAWGDESLSTNDRMDRAAVRFKIDQFNDDTTLALMDEPELF